MGAFRSFRRARRHCAVLLLLTAVAAAQDKPTPQATNDGPIPKDVLERIERLEREVIELRTKTGQVPADKKDQRVITLLETPYLGSPGYWSGQQPRVFIVKLGLVNLTDKPITLKQSDVELSLDGQIFPIKELNQNQRYQSIQMGQQSVQLQNLQMKKELALSAGGTNSTWVMFSDLPPGNHVPQLKLKLKLPEGVRDVDINQQQRDALGIKVERLGPRGCLGLISLAGELNTISAGALVEELDRLSADKVARVVVKWDEAAPAVDHMIMNWLQQSTAGSRPFGADTPLPSLPVTIREFHLARIPTDPNRGYGYQNAGRIHKDDVEAVVAALHTAYEVLPRDELFQSIQSPNRLEKIAALSNGGGRLESERLPFLLQAADDKDPAVQKAALQALSHFGEKEALDKLLSYIKKNSDPLAETAIASLAGSRYSAAHDLLLDILKNEPPESKKTIVRVLARFPRPVWSEAIYEFVTDSRAGLNSEALTALVQVGHPKLVSVLKDALLGKDAGLRNQAFGVLSQRTDQESEEIALKYTLDHIAKNPPDDMMLQMLQRVKDRRAVPLLTAQFDKVQNKSSLVQTLAMIGDADTSSFLVGKYPNLQSHEKAVVLQSLSKFDMPKFRELAGPGLASGDNQVANAIVQGLVEDASPASITLLVDTLEKSSNNNTWQQVLNSLSQLATPQAKQALMKARDSGNKEKARMASNALLNIRQRSPGYGYVSQGQQLANEATTAPNDEERKKKFKEAVEMYTRGVEADPELPEAYSGRGNTYLQQEMFPEAVKDLQKAVELDPWNNMALTGLCIVMVAHEGKHAEAVKKLEENRERFGENNLYCYNAACVYGRAVEAVKKNDKLQNRDKLVEDYTKAGLDNLRQAVQRGFRDFDWMKKDPDLREFQKLPEFEPIAQAPKEGAANNRKGARAARAVQAVEVKVEAATP